MKRKWEDSKEKEKLKTENAKRLKSHVYTDSKGNLCFTHFKKNEADKFSPDHGKNTDFTTVKCLERYLIKDLKLIVLEYVFHRALWYDGDAIMMHREQIFYPEMMLNIKLGIYNFSDRSWYYAAVLGNVPMLHWLSKNKVPGCTNKIMDFAAAKNQLSVVKYLHDNRKEGCTKDALARAALNGHYDMVVWLCKNRNEGGGRRAIDNAAKAGHLNIIKYLHANRKDGCTKNAMDQAAKTGRLDILKWLHRYTSEGCSPKAVQFAKAAGHKHVVQWLLEKKIG